MDRDASDLLSISLEEERGALVVAPVGELDIASAPELHAAFVEAATRVREASAATDGAAAGMRVVLDLGGLTFVDSVGLGTLLEGRRTFEDLGIELRLVAAPGDAASRLLHTTALDEVFPIHEDRGSALEA